MLHTDPEIDLYKTGFQADDIFDRRDLGKHLTTLVDTSPHSFSVAIDGDWGVGKSDFLKRWCGAHTNENGGKATVVYLDAFAADYLDDPLVALTMAITARLEATTGTLPKAWAAAKDAAARLAMPIARVGLAVATARVSEIAGTAAGAAAQAGSDELDQAAKRYWEVETGRHKAVEDFRDALSDLAKEGTDNPQRLVLVIDELDRCRPDYALSMLEILKHFFVQPNVCFVLGANLPELENSVRARYGAGINAAKYLQKFIQLRIPLSVHAEVGLGGAVSKYVSQCIQGTQLSQKGASLIRIYVVRASWNKSVSLRDIQRIATLAEVTPSGWQDDESVDLFLVPALIVLRILRPDWIETLRQDTSLAVDILTLFSFGTNSPQPQNITEKLIHDALDFALENRFSYNDKIHRNLLENYSVDDAGTILPKLIDRYIDRVDLYQP